MKPKKLYENIVEQLMQRIQSGELQPGMRLPAERVLEKEYGVSRPVVREAFRAMEQMGCVETRVGEGTFVKTPELSDVMDPISILFMKDAAFAEELLETRILLETGIAQLAATRRSEANLKELQNILGEMKRDIQQGGTGEVQDLKFHALLLKAAGNRALEIVISTCSEVLNRTVTVTQRIEGVPLQALKEHENILQAVMQCDGTAAARYMHDHLSSAQQNLKKRTEGQSNTP